MTMDLVDQANCIEAAEHQEQVKAAIRAEFEKLDDNTKLQLSRDLMIDQIYNIVNKFPLHTQKEILAIITDQYLNEWAG